MWRTVSIGNHRSQRLMAHHALRCCQDTSSYQPVTPCSGTVETLVIEKRSPEFWQNMENHREKQENSRRCEVKPPKWTPTHEQSKNVVPFHLKRQEGDLSCHDVPQSLWVCKHMLNHPWENTAEVLDRKDQPNFIITDYSINDMVRFHKQPQRVKGNWTVRLNSVAQFFFSFWPPWVPL